jgi:TolB protein
MNFLNPKWSPDSNKIVFHSVFGDIAHERGAIYVMKKDGTDIRKITDDDVYNFNPFFSPDSKGIAYNTGDDDAAISIHVMDADGSNARLVSDGTCNTN